MEHAIIPDDRSVTFINDFGADANLAIARLLGWQPQPVKSPTLAVYHFPPALVEEARRSDRAAQLKKDLREQEAMCGLL